MPTDNSVNNYRIVNWRGENCSLKASVLMITTQRRLEIEPILTKHQTPSNMITNFMLANHK